jgi:putative oxidoreductase
MTTTSPASPAPTRDNSQSSTGLTRRSERAQLQVARWLAAHSVDALRISLSLVILGFGALKYFPGASPAAGLAMRTTETLTMGLVSGTPAVVATAVVETVIGLVLLTGRFLKPGLIIMTAWLGGIMAPVVLFASELFPGGLPTLTAQYVLKDIILVAAAMVVAAHTLGARLRVAEQR